MTVEELLKPRYKVIADYPKSIYKIGDILRVGGHSEDLLYCDHSGPRMRDYPHLFRKLEWWEERTLDDMVSVKFAKVIEYVGYWRVGDIVPVEDYIINNGKFHSYKLKYGKHHQPKFLLPAIETEYLTFKP